MTRLRISLAIVSVSVLAAASTVLLGAGAANALPAGFINPVGTVTASTSGTTLTLTQTSDVAVVDFTTLTTDPGDIIDIVQDAGDVLVIRNTGAAQAAFSGVLFADATVVITSPAGLVVAGSIDAGGDLVLTTGAITDADAQLPEIEIDPTVDDGLLGIGEDAALRASGSVILAGDFVVHEGTIHAYDGYAALLSAEFLTYFPGSAEPITSEADGLVNGSLVVSGYVYANGAVVTYAPEPSFQAIDGQLVSNGAGEIEEATTLLLGPGGAPEGLDASAYSNIDDEVGSQFPAFAMSGFESEFGWDALSLGSGGETAPTASAFLGSGLTLGEGAPYEFGFVLATCSVEEGERSTTVSIIEPTLLDVPLAPVGYDFDVPNQPALPIGDSYEIAFNEQVHTTVGGWDVLTVTAIHLTGIDDLDVRIGVVSCAVPAASVLASTGSSVHASPLLVGSAVLLVGGVLLVIRRRRHA